MLSPPTKSGGGIGMASVQSSVRGFRPLSQKVITQLTSNLVFIYTCWVSVQIWFVFGLISALKIVVSDHSIWKTNHSIHFTFGGWVRDECSELIHFWAILVWMTENGFRPLFEKLANHRIIFEPGVYLWVFTLVQFWPSSGKKNIWKHLVVSNHYLKN